MRGHRHSKREVGRRGARRRDEQGTKVDPVDIIAFCKERIAHYKCPRSVEIRDEPLPMSGPGKILKRELRAPCWEGRKWQVS
jgi:long-chain acyl-CoA synthetase